MDETCHNLSILIQKAIMSKPTITILSHAPQTKKQKQKNPLLITITKSYSFPVSPFSDNIFLTFYFCFVLHLAFFLHFSGCFRFIGFRLSFTSCSPLISISVGSLLALYRFRSLHFSGDTSYIHGYASPPRIAGIHSLHTFSPSTSSFHCYRASPTSFFLSFSRFDFSFTSIKCTSFDDVFDWSFFLSLHMFTSFCFVSSPTIPNLCSWRTIACFYFWIQRNKSTEVSKLKYIKIAVHSYHNLVALFSSFLFVCAFFCFVERWGEQVTGDWKDK